MEEEKFMKAEPDLLRGSREVKRSERRSSVGGKPRGGMNVDFCAARLMSGRWH